MHIAFDNSHRFRRRVYYFEYKSVRFKLIQNNPNKWSDVLLTLLPDGDELLKDKVRTIAGEFLSLLSWQTASRIAVQFLGCSGVSDDFHLRSAKCLWHVPPQLSRGYLVTRGDLPCLPVVTTENQRIALALFREALSSNKVMLSFLFYWQILEIADDKPSKWVDDLCGRLPKPDLPWRDINQLGLGTRSLGNYLWEDCRSAIAHIKRKPGRVAFKFDLAMESRRLAISTRIVSSLARIYISERLMLRGKMRLRPGNDPVFPVFVDEES